ncbi:7755_t:CDS:2, partial [Gigaspora margarita]
MEFSEKSDASIIELDLMPTADHKNQVYCKCSSCAKKSYSSNWSSNSELLSDENNDHDKLKPVCDQDLSWLDSDIEMQNSFETQDLFLLDINAKTLSETSSKIQDSVISSSDNEILQKSSNSESFLENEFFTYNTTSDDFSDSEDNYLVDKFSTCNITSDNYSAPEDDYSQN